MKNILTIATLTLALAISTSAVSAKKADAPGQNQGPTIVDVALSVNAASGEFSILIAALQAADPAVLETLSGKGQFTVFAPTDMAFADLLEEFDLTLGDVVSDPAALTNILLYHVARGSRYAEDVIESDQIRTLNKSFLYQDGGFLTDQNGRTAEIVATDIPAVNGVIHVINKVVLP
jgi:uncharacterized surface protein with fasciclin (FAS1) repeats